MLHAADFLASDIAPDNIIVRADGTPVRSILGRPGAPSSR